MTDDQGGGKPDFLVAGPGEAADVLMVLDEAAAWLQGRGIAQWPPRFEPSWVEAAIGRGETWLVKVGGTVSATVTLDLADPVWDGIAGSALYVHRMAVRRRAAGLGAAVLGWASGVARERGLVSLPGGDYWPALADIPDQKGWRVSNSSDYGPLTTFARGKLDLARIRANWSDILRVVVSIYTGEVRAYDVVRMLQRDGHPTALGEAIAMYGRIPKTLHICSLAAEEAYRRDIKGMRNLQEGRHALAGKTFHGKKGELYQRYHEGMEDQLGELGLILNCIVLWNTRYMNAALDRLRAQGCPVLDEDVARLSPFLRLHLNVVGKYSFLLPDLGEAGIRELRDPDAEDYEIPG